MSPYFCLLICSALFSYISLSEKKRLCLIVGNNEHIKNTNLGLPVFFSLLIILVACRNINIGNDTENYSNIFYEYSHQTFSQIVGDSNEILYGVLNWFIGKICGDFQFFLLVTAILSIFPIAKLYCQDRKHCYLKIVMFLNLSTFCMLFSGIRQSIAVALGIVAFKYVKEKKILKYFLCIVLAFGFHRSSFILAVLYPIYHLKLKKIHLSIIVPFWICTMVFNQQIFAYLARLMNLISDRYELVSIVQTNAYSVLILFIAFAIITYVIPKEELLTLETKGYRNILLLAVFLQCFASVHVLAMRMNYYFIILIPITIGKVMDVPKVKFKKITRALEIALCVFFTIYFVLTIINANFSGGNLHTVPYSPFWSAQF